MISERIGNISLIIFAGIVAGIPEVLQRIILDFNVSKIPTPSFAVMTIAVIAGVVSDTRRKEIYQFLTPKNQGIGFMEDQPHICH